MCDWCTCTEKDLNFKTHEQMNTLETEVDLEKPCGIAASDNGVLRACSFRHMGNMATYNSHCESHQFQFAPNKRGLSDGKSLNIES